MNVILILIKLFILIKFALLAPVEGDLMNLELIILHNSDIHGRFEEIDINGNQCTNELALDNKCFGGFARTAHVIREYRENTRSNNGKPVLYLNTGDTFTGTVWFSLFKDEISSKFLNLLEPNATTLGNHEFDLGVKKLEKFLNNFKFPMIVSNLDLNQTPTLNRFIEKSKVIEINGYKIGFVGYLTPDTAFQSSIGDVIINPEIEAVNKEAEKLKANGVNIIIALGHSGFDVDKKIAENCHEIDLIIGAHSHTFLYNGTAPNIEVPEGVYPTIVEQSSGKKVPILHSYYMTKYLGYLEVKFDAQGNLIEWFGNPILLDSTIHQDEDILKEFDVYRPKYEQLNYKVGETDIKINGERNQCRKYECNLGSLLTDAMLYVRETSLERINKSQDAVVALAQAGGIKASINEGVIRNFDILNALSYNNTLVAANTTGKYLLNAMERTVSIFRNNIEDGGYLQFSGLKVIFDLNKPIGERVIDIKIRCLDCKNVDGNETYVQLELNKEYLCIFTKFLFNGGDEYQWSDDNKNHKSEKLDWTDFTALQYFINNKSPIEFVPSNRQIYVAEKLNEK